MRCRLEFAQPEAMRCRKKRSDALSVGNQANPRRDPAITVHPQSSQSFLSGLALYEARPDKEYSLTDCISMLVMRQEAITEVLTNDDHYKQEGFTILL